MCDHYRILDLVDLARMAYQVATPAGAVDANARSLFAASVPVGPGEALQLTANQTPLNLQPRYNIAPTQDVPVVRSTRKHGGRELVLMRWGLVPFWAKDVVVGSKMINARAETIALKPAFRHAFRQRRCVVVADGFYEWARTPASGKQPYFISVARAMSRFAFAGFGKLGSSRRRKDRELPHHCHGSERKTAGDS